MREALPALEAPKHSLIDFDWKSQALKDEALESRLDLRQAKLIIETTSMAIRQNLAGYLPTISAGASVSKAMTGSSRETSNGMSASICARASIQEGTAKPRTPDWKQKRRQRD